MKEREQMVEEVTVAGQTVRLLHQEVPIEEVTLDENNPRIRYRLRLMTTKGKSLDDVILALPEVKKLRLDIERTGGLRERVILQENGTTKKTIEGNCRLVCLRSLHAKHPDEPRWATVHARVLPKDVDPRHVAILLSDFHIAGKITWQAHEKAGQVHHMHDELHMSQDDIAAYLRASKATVNRYLKAYGLMDVYLGIDDGKYAEQGERKWSYFEEFFKQPTLRDEFKSNPEFGNSFCRWVGEGRIPEGADVRKLPGIMRHGDARKKFEKGASFAEAIKLVEAAEPEQGSDFFKLLAKLKESCSSAAQVKEILRIRSDKVARQRLLDTYSSLVDFMRLADVEIPEES
jgi:hypothetical protein